MRHRICVFVFMSLIPFGLLVGWPGSTPSVARGHQTAEEAAGIARLLGSYHRLDQFHGTALVARNGKEVYRGAFGLASRELNVPHTTQTRFAIASFTKTFTAMMALKLVDQGKLRLDGVIRDYLPGYPSENGKRITVLQLLTHTSGMQVDIADFPSQGNEFPPIVAKINADFYSLDELVALIAKRPLAFRPGERWGYSSDGYGVLGAIAAKAWGKPYEQALREMFLHPLGMSDTGYVPQTHLLPRRAAGYRQTFDGYENSRPMGISPAGGMYSTVGDLAKWDRALFGEAALSAAAKELAWAPSPYITSYGWKVKQDPGVTRQGARRVQCSGGLPGFSALMTRALDDGVTVILLANTRDMTFRLEEITDGLFAVMRGTSPSEPRASVASELVEQMRRGGVEAVLEHFRKHKREGFKTAYLNEREMNALGYYWLGRGQHGEAVAVLRLTVESFPDSWNAHDSLGEASLAAGDRAAAVRHYSRSVELNPQNDNGRKVLDGLKGDNKPGK
jgi:CubicO group peptidase (beta-lactamase class C family)